MAQQRPASRAVSAFLPTKQLELPAKGGCVTVVAGTPFGQAGTTNALRVARVK